jgi:type IV secretory pathway VirB2 component (pilin)
MKYFMGRNIILSNYLILLASMAPLSAHAAVSGTSGLTFLDFLWVIVNYLQGPVITALAVIAIVMASLIIMFLDVSRGAKLGVSVVLGISIATTALGLLGALGIQTVTF